MHKTLLMFAAAVLCLGCGRATVSSPDENLTSGTLIDGFGNEPRVLTSSKIIRVGTYYDFSEYDSVRISFRATRLATDRPFDEILVKIGPSTYLRDSVFAILEHVSLTVSVSAISKPTFCALTFWTLDPLTVLELSDLRVVGWRSE